MGLKDHMANNPPIDPRSKPITIGRVNISYSTNGEDWGNFISTQPNLSPDLIFESSSLKVQETYMEMIKNRCVRNFSTNLSANTPYYFVEETRVQRGSIVVTLDLSMLPKDISFILSLSSVLLYKTLKNYETMKNNARLVVKDVTNVLGSVQQFVATNMPSYLSMNFEQDIANIVIALGIAAIYDENPADAEEIDKNHMEKLAQEEEALRERVKSAEEEGRLINPNAIQIH